MSFPHPTSASFSFRPRAPRFKLNSQTSGSCYGNEELISAAPPGIVLGILLLAPIFYCLPLSMLVAEMSTARPVDGGQVAWAEEAWGPAVGAKTSTDIIMTHVLSPAFVKTALPQRRVAWSRSRCSIFHRADCVLVLRLCCVLIGASGLQNAFWIWTSYIFDCAVYPTLSAGYIAQLAGWVDDDGVAEPFWTGMLGMAIVAVITAIKLVSESN